MNVLLFAPALLVLLLLRHGILRTVLHITVCASIQVHFVLTIPLFLYLNILLIFLHCPLSTYSVLSIGLYLEIKKTFVTCLYVRTNSFEGQRRGDDHFSHTAGLLEKWSA